MSVQLAVTVKDLDAVYMRSGSQVRFGCVCESVEPSRQTLVRDAMVMSNGYTRNGNTLTLTLTKPEP
jgi:hypothetical protein